MGIFDSDSFLQARIDGELATRRTPLPPGDCIAQITKLDTVSGDKDGRAWYKLNVQLTITDQDYLARAGKEQAMVTYGLMLDVNDGGGIAMGPDKNVRLGKLREATGTNQPGKALNDMLGQYIRVKISNRPDPNDSSIVYDDVTAVARA